MERSSDKITYVQSVMIFMMTIGINVHAILIPFMFRVGGRDSWFAVFISSLLAFPAMLFILYIVRASKQRHLGFWIREQLPTVFAYGLMVLMVLPIFLDAAIAVRETCCWAKIFFYPITPRFFLLIILIALSFFSAYAGITSIALTSGILLPLVILFGIFAGFSSIPHKDLSLLFPLLEHGWNPMFRAIIYSASGFSELFIILFFQHYVKQGIRYWMLALNVVIVLILIVGQLYAAISEFGPTEAAMLRFPSFQEWRLVTFGHFFEHLDFLAIFQWIAGAFIHVSFLMFLIVEFFGVRKNRPRAFFFASLFAGAIAFDMIPVSDRALFDWIQQIIVPGYLYWICAITFMLVILAWRSKRKDVLAK